jgi:hypothetical protein
MLHKLALLLVLCLLVLVVLFILRVPTVEIGALSLKTNAKKSFTSDVSVSSDTAKNQHQNQNPRTRVQTIAILPGPHKTGTTSVQAALYHWISSSNNTSSPFQEWAYPVPTMQEFQSIHSGITVTGGKGFSPFLTRLFSASQTRYRNDSVVQLYRNSLQLAWEHEGKNIVLASEHMDRLAREQEQANININSNRKSDSAALLPTQQQEPISTEELLHRLIESLPDSPLVQRRIVVGVAHRVPRVDHLVSLWHQLGKRHESLLEYVTKTKRGLLDANYYNLNSLGLADVFVQRGYEVVVVVNNGTTTTSTTTTSDNHHHHVDFPMAMACHVLGVPCQTKNGQVMMVIAEEGNNNNRTMITSSATRLNVRPDDGERGLDQDTLDAINGLLQEYDCQFVHDFVERDNVKLVFADALFSNCHPSATKRGATKLHQLSETIQAIVDLVCARYYKYPFAKDCPPK